MMSIDGPLNLDTVLIIASYLELQELVMVSQTCRLWYFISRQYGQFWTNVVRRLPPAHLQKTLSWSDYALEDIRRASIKTGRAAHTWNTASVIRPTRAIRLDTSNRSVHVVPGTRWMLSLQPEDRSSVGDFLPIEVYDLQTGCLVGAANSKYTSRELKDLPDWQVSVSISPTEMVVCLQDYYANSSVHHIYQISVDSERLSITCDLLRRLDTTDATATLSSDGRFICLIDHGYVQVHYLASDINSQALAWQQYFESDDDTYSVFYGDCLLVFVDESRLCVLHLPTMLHYWPTKFPALDDALPTPPSHLIHKIGPVNSGETARSLYNGSNTSQFWHKVSILCPENENDEWKRSPERTLDLIYTKQDATFLYTLSGRVPVPGNREGLTACWGVFKANPEG